VTAIGASLSCQESPYGVRGILTRRARKLPHSYLSAGTHCHWNKHKEAAARKVVNIGGNQRVALVAGWADRVSVQAEGDAEVLLGAEREKYGRIHQEQVPKSRAFREDFTLVKMVPTWLRYFDARPESFSIVETPLV
jgi:hypothetical protein